MPDATITSTASTFGTISGTFAADQSTVTGTVTGLITGTLTGSVGVPGPAGPAGAGVPAGGTEGQIIVKQSATDYDTAWADNAAETLTATVRNETGATLAKGTVVYISGAAGNKALVSKASASSEATSSKTFAILSEEIPNNQNGQSVTVGLLKGLDTSALTEGGSLWLSTTAGQWTQTMPTAPNHAVFLGTVTRVHANQGTVEVRIQNGYELQELHNVKITSVANGQVLKYDSAQSLWVNGTDSSGVAWGAITGTLSAQTDLQTALDGKYSTSNPAGYITSSALTGYATQAWVDAQGYLQAGALTGYALESWVTAGFYPLTGNPSGFLTSASLTAYLTKADNLGSLTSFSTARDNLGIGTANTPVFAGLTVQGSGANVANLTPTSLTLTHATAGQFTIQPSQGIVFPDATIQTTAYPGPAGATAWGTITGTLSSQTDLQTALDGKYSTSNPAGYITSSALTGYATESWVTAGFYPLTGNPSGFITSSALTPYAPLAGATFTGKVNFKAGTTSSASINLAPGVAPTSPSTGDVWFDSSTSKVVFRSSALTQNIASELWVTSQSYITASALAGYATESWVTAGFYPLTGNPSGFITSSALTGYATESWVTSQGYLTSASLSGYATESWVTTQLGSYLTTSAAASTYLTQSNAASTYQTQAAMSSYPTISYANATYAPLSSPALTGNPTAPTPATSDNDTSIATTAFVKAQGYLTTAPVTSVAGKTGAVTLVVGDVSGAAPLASPALTGTPTAPTATLGTNTTQIATTAFVLANAPSTSFATTAQVVAGTSTTTALAPANVGFLVANPRLQPLAFINVTSLSGSGAALTSTPQQFGRQVYLSSLATGRAAYIFGVINTANAGFGTSTAKADQVDFSKKVWLSGYACMGWTGGTSYIGDANTICRITLGGYSSATTGDMTLKGIGLKKVGGASSFVNLTVHNGTTRTDVASSVTVPDGGGIHWMIYSDGTGNVTLYINGTQAATTTAGPTTATASGQACYREQVEAVSTPGVRHAMNCNGGWFYTE
jgi:hypothetical protein